MANPDHPGAPFGCCGSPSPILVLWGYGGNESRGSIAAVLTRVRVITPQDELTMRLRRPQSNRCCGSPQVRPVPQEHARRLLLPAAASAPARRRKQFLWAESLWDELLAVWPVVTLCLLARVAVGASS